MPDTAIITELRAALRRQGVWGLRSQRLIEEWTEHLREDAAQRVARGAAPEAAQEAAWKALGSPDQLAVKAGCELAQASWLGRHPWLGGLGLPMLAWLALLCAISLLPAWLASRFWDIEVLEHTHPAALHASLQCWQVIFNWLPWLVAMLWLARIAVRMPGGWKLFWVTAIALTIYGPALCAVVQLPQHGPGSGSLNIIAVGFFGVIVKVLCSLAGAGAAVGPWSSLFRFMGMHPGPLIQTMIMVLGAAVFYVRMSGDYRRPATSVGVAAGLLILAYVGAPTVVL